MSTVHDFAAAKAELVQEAQAIAFDARTRRSGELPYGLAEQCPANAVALVLDALWQRPHLLRPLAAYFAELEATQSDDS